MDGESDWRCGIDYSIRNLGAIAMHRNIDVGRRVPPHLEVFFFVDTAVEND